MNEKDAREYVSKLRRFYTGAFIYAVVNLGLILIWAISGGGYFWPIWVIVGWGIGLGVHAFYLGLIPQINTVAPFMSKEWEENEVRRVMKNKSASADPFAKPATKKAEMKAEEVKSPAPEKKAAVKKTAPKKKATKRAPAKKSATKKKA